MKIRASGNKLCLSALIAISSALSLHLHAAAQICNTGVCVTTWQQDTGVPDAAGGVYRTGENLMESTIVASTFNNNGFGQLCSTDVGGVAQLDGQVYAQPLVLTNVTINTHMYFYIVYVVTQNDTIYAIDGTPTVGTNCKIRNSYPFLTTKGSVIYGQTAVPCTDFAGGPCGTIQPTVGILGTPVIDQSTGTIYLVTQSTDGKGNFYHYLHALDAQTFAPKFNGPVLICPTQPCTNGSTFSLTHIQRPALLLANCGTSCGNQNYVYVAFSMMDGTTAKTPPNGAIFGYQGIGSQR